MTKALELAKFGRESAPAGAVVGDSDAQTLSAKTFSDNPVFSGGGVNSITYLNGSKVLTSNANFVFDGTNMGLGSNSPVTKLHIGGAPIATSGALIYLRDTTAAMGTASLGGIAFFSSPGTDYYIGKKNNVAGTSWLSFGNANNGTEYAIIDSNGNLGIGTSTTTNGRLSVYETTVAKLYLTDSTLGTSYGAQVRGYGASGAGGFLELGVIDNNVYNSAVKVFNQATQISFYTNSGTNGSTAERVRIDTNGNVVIGSSNPYNTTTDKLTVIKAQSALTQVVIDNQSSNPAAGASLSLSAYGGGTTLSVPSATPGFNPFIIAVNGTERFRITSAGYLGLGTADPQSLLTVNSGGTDNLAAVTINQTTDFAATSRAGFSGLTNNNGGFYFGMGANGTGIPAGFGFFREASGWNTALAFYTNNQTSGTYSTRAMQEKMRLTSAGNLGIGTATPAAKLTVVGSTLFNGTALGLGEASPSYGGISFGFDGGPNLAQIIAVNASTSSLGFYTKANGAAPTERMRIDAAGNIGIGTTSPSATLTVVGSLRVENSSTGSFGLQAVGNVGAARDIFLAGQSGYSNGFTVRYNGSNMAYAFQNGNVGIGTTNPTETLHVSGNIIADTAYLANGNARLHFYTYQIGDAYSYAHLKTNIPWENHTQMYSVEITGHEYGASKPINAQLVWYSYSPNAGVVSVGSSGTHIMELYRSTDGYVVIRVSLPSGYYTAFTVSQYTTNQGLGRITILGSAGHNSSNFY